MISTRLASKTSAVALVAAALGASALVAAAEDAVRAPGDQEALTARAFSASRTHQRRRDLVRALGDHPLVVVGSGRSTESDASRHRADRSFLYLSGVEDAGCFMVIDADRETLYAPVRNKAQEIWTGVHVGPGEETARRFGFDGARPVSDLAAGIAGALGKTPRKVFVAGLTDEERKTLFPEGSQLEGAEAAIGRLRQVKDQDELALMQRAAEISATAMRACARAIAPKRFEYEVQGLFEGCCRFYGAETQGYPSIVGSGPNSCVLHYDKDRRLMEAGDMLVLDAAGECGGYSADVTRSWPVSGHFTAEQRRVYDAVLKAQDAGIAACRPGTTVREVGEASRAVLKSEGLLEYLPHGVSHWLGLDVHDAGDYRLPLAPGMVLTVEPGCYVAAKELGVRIEDDILVTEEGPVNLSAYAPRSADEIEALIARARKGAIDLPPLPAPAPLPALVKHKGKLY
jgi:Xaa-Pro aminopeptidase